jgi:hypothetical protein
MQEADHVISFTANVVNRQVVTEWHGFAILVLYQPVGMMGMLCFAHRASQDRIGNHQLTPTLSFLR